jgi:hypothetical protein
LKWHVNHIHDEIENDWWSVDKCVLAKARDDSQRKARAGCVMAFAVNTEKDKLSISLGLQIG